MEEEMELDGVQRKGCLMEEFKEVQEILRIIDITTSIARDQTSSERSLERFSYIVGQYQEQPHLLDPHLKMMLDKLLEIIKSNVDDKPVVHMASQFLYILTKTRGHKSVACILPHEVSDLHPLLLLLFDEDHNTSEAFECKYMLLLWLSIVCIVPFDLSKFDDIGEKNKESTADKIFGYGQKYLSCNNRCQEMSSMMLARFLSRPDIGPSKLSCFVDWALNNISSDFTKNETVTTTAGMLFSFSSLLKHGRREEVVKYAEEIFGKIEVSNLLMSNNTKLRKLSIKVIHRIGLAFLKPKLASWRYKRGFRSLSDNLQTDALATGDCSGGFDGDLNGVDEFDEVPDLIEQVIEKLLVGLKDKDTTVRWSAAKGIGRITGRLPLSLADEVVGSVMELFSYIESEDGRHGGCLCLGELGHRGLLLPRRLKEVVSVVMECLIYDERKGTCSVGSNVRDAASFICWSFARAYDAFVLQPFIQDLVRCLVVVCLFDREVKVRRAASAALQELVGRQGNVVHGIDITTACDYFAVGNRNNCYLQLSTQVAEYGTFRGAVVEHLMNLKISHWDISIRELAGEAVGILVSKSINFFLNSGLKKLLTSCTSDDFCTRHGALLSSAHVMLSLTLHAIEHDESVDDLVEDETVWDVIGNLLGKLKGGRCFRGVHGDVMRRAFCFFINKMCLTKFKPQSASIIDEWMDFLSECLHNPECTVQESALEAISSLVQEYYIGEEGKIEALIEYCSKELNNVNSHVRCAYCSMLGHLPASILLHKNHLKQILTMLYRHSLYYPYLSSHPSNLLKDAPPPSIPSTVEERRDAVKALARVCCKIGRIGSRPGLTYEEINMVYEVLFVSMNDYTLDNRGDVGTCVRESCMSALYDVTSLTIGQTPSVLTPDICSQMFCHLIQQSSEKIDRTRSTAGEVFHKLLYHEPEIINIPQVDLLKLIFTRDEILSINWSSPSNTFPKFVQLLSCPDYSYHLILGTIVSSGGLTESLVKYSATSLMSQLKSLSTDQVLCFGRTIVKIFYDYLKVERVTVPILKTLDKLLTNECFDCIPDENRQELAVELSRVCTNEVNKSGDVKKLLASINVFCGLIQMSNGVRNTCLSQLMMFLCHRFPIIRKACASRMYEFFMSCDHLVDDSCQEDISTLLIETDWDHPIEQLRPIRNNLCSLLGIPAPVLIKGKK